MRYYWYIYIYTYIYIYIYIYSEESVTVETNSGEKTFWYPSCARGAHGLLQVRLHRNEAASSLAADCKIPQRPPDNVKRIKGERKQEGGDQKRMEKNL